MLICFGASCHCKLYFTIFTYESLDCPFSCQLFNSFDFSVSNVIVKSTLLRCYTSYSASLCLCRFLLSWFPNLLGILGIFYVVY